MDILTRALQGATMLRGLHFLSPAIVVLAYFIASLARFFRSKNPLPKQENNGGERRMRMAAQILTALMLASYASESVLLACVLPNHAATSSDDKMGGSV